MKSLLIKIREKLRPNNIIITRIDQVVKKVNATLKKEGLKADCIKGGSLAKETFLKNDFDADLFVRFDYSLKDKPLSDILEKALKKSFKIERVHGSRDYFQIHNDITIEIVPVLKIKDYKKAVNVTDMSPLHVDYVKKKLRKEQRDEVRLAKQFCKSAKVYGAESYIQGFSGHIIDLLIIHYESFEQLLMQASVWGDKVIIDPEHHLVDPLKELNSSKTHSPLIIVDPVQPDRNAAAAMSKEKFTAFKNRCKEFLKNPSEEFFKVKKIDKKEVEKNVKKNEELYFIQAKTLKGKKDVVGSKLMKAYEFMKFKIKKNGFQIIESNWEYNSVGIFYFIIKKEVLSDKEILPGPPTSEKVGVKRFKAKHKKTFEKNKRLYAEEKRKYKTTKQLFKDLLKEKYVMERTNKIFLV